MKLLIINGPNLNMLGIREPELYGTNDYAAMVKYCEDACRNAGCECEIFQSNHEGAIVDRIQQAFYDNRQAAAAGSGSVIGGIVINPAAYTHTSVAILDALKAVGIPAAEVHLTDISEREDFRKISYAGMACERTFAGYGFEGYKMAVDYLVSKYGS